MAIDLVNRDGSHVLMLSGVVDVFDATALHTAAVEAAASPGSVVANLARVEAVDTASTQVLLALKRAMAAQGYALKVEGTPSGVAEFWKQGGFGAELES